MSTFIIGQGEPHDKQSIQLSTRLCNHIPNERREEQDPSTLLAAFEIHKKTWPHITLRSATGMYNCMGMIFSSRRVWIDPESLYDILRDDGYKKLANEPDLRQEDLVVYKNTQNQVSHIGLVYNIAKDLERARFKIKVLSKWGAYGEYIHEIDEVSEFFGQPSEFWTDRKDLS